MWDFFSGPHNVQQFWKVFFGKEEGNRTMRLSQFRMNELFEMRGYEFRSLGK